MYSTIIDYEDLDNWYFEIDFPFFPLILLPFIVFESSTKSQIWAAKGIVQKDKIKTYLCFF